MRMQRTEARALCDVMRLTHKIRDPLEVTRENSEVNVKQMQNAEVAEKLGCKSKEAP